MVENIRILHYDGTGNKNMRTTCFEKLLQNESKRDVVRFTSHVQTGQFAASCANTNFLLDKITWESRHTCKEITSLASKEVYLGPVKRATRTDLRSETTFHNLQQVGKHAPSLFFFRTAIPQKNIIGESNKGIFRRPNFLVVPAADV